MRTLPRTLVRAQLAARPAGVLTLIILAVLSLLALGPGGAAQSPYVAVVPVDDTITPPLARFVTGAIADAADAGAQAVVLTIDTPGGLLSATDEIIAAILASEVPVIAYVSPTGGRAASAGVFITYAAPLAAMAPGTRIGSASPVLTDDGGGLVQNDTMTAKVTNDAVSQLRNLATMHGRNAEWAETAVRDAANITAEEAMASDVVNLIAPDLPALLNAIDGRTVSTAAGPVTLATAGATLTPVTMGWLDGLLQILANPTIAYILLSLGSLGLVLELSNPGAVVPGVVGGLALLLGLYSLGTLPVNWTGALLMALAFILLAVDIFVASFGMLTIGGIVAFVLGSYLLFDTDVPGFDIAQPVIWTISLLLVLFFAFVGGSVLMAAFRKPVTGKEALIGVVGVVRQPLQPDGMIFATGELWQASLAAAGDGPLAPGTAVVITGIDELRLIVRPATAAEAASGGVAVIDDQLAAAPPAATQPGGAS